MFRPLTSLIGLSEATRYAVPFGSLPNQWDIAPEAYLLVLLKGDTYLGFVMSKFPDPAEHFYGLRRRAKVAEFLHPYVVEEPRRKWFNLPPGTKIKRRDPYDEVCPETITIDRIDPETLEVHYTKFRVARIWPLSKCTYAGVQLAKHLIHYPAKDVWE